MAKIKRKKPKSIKIKREKPKEIDRSKIFYDQIKDSKNAPKRIDYLINLYWNIAFPDLLIPKDKTTFQKILAIRYRLIFLKYQEKGINPPKKTYMNYRAATQFKTENLSDTMRTVYNCLWLSFESGNDKRTKRKPCKIPKGAG